MHDRIRGFRAAVACLLVALVSVTLAACGSSGPGSATGLLGKTFSGSHPVNSGNLTFSLRLTPGGSKTLNGPITISFGGPFQSLGKGKLPKSDFTVSLGALGRSVSLGILSTGTSGYVSLAGTSYRLPAATFQKLESSFSQFETTGSGSSSSPLSKLGIKPLHWLVDPKVAGTDSVAGTSTTHITAGLNVAALLRGVSAVLGKASSLGLSGAGKLPTSIPSATQSRIAGEVERPSFDVWTGSSDNTVRRLLIQLTLPVTGALSSYLGGLSSAALGLTIQYADLNQPQTIVAPTKVAPYSQFTAKLKAFVTELQAAVEEEAEAGSSSGATTGATTGAGSTGTGSTGTGSTGTGSTGTTTGSGSTKVSPYDQCIEAAGQDVLKMQKCASLINNK